MKVAFSSLFVVLTVALALPAMAQDQNVSRDALSALGLGGMKKVSDERAMAVRGKAFASVGGGSIAFVGLSHQGEMSISTVISMDANGYKAFQNNATPSTAQAQATPIGATVAAQLVVPPNNTTFTGTALAGNAANFSLFGGIAVGVPFATAGIPVAPPFVFP